MTRECPWYVIEIPELDICAQARSAGEVEYMARETIGLMPDVASDSFNLDIRQA